MKLHSVVLENFGLFGGSHQLDLSPIPGKPLTLIAGMNGAGKTTLLEAVQLTLYGRISLGPRVSTREYHAYLRQKIHRGDGMTPAARTASVGVEFDHETMGESARYMVTRRWALESNGIESDFLVKRDGAPLDDVDSLYWEDFVKELVPPGVSQLFFFDGEKIQRLADDDDSALIGESIKALLGLDLIERLQADLTLFRERQLKKAGTPELRKEILAVQKQHKELDKRLVDLRDGLADLVARGHGIDREMERGEAALTRAGGKFVANREHQTLAKAKAQTEREAAERKIRTLADTALPLAFCPNLCKRLLRQLSDEQTATRSAIVAGWAADRMDFGRQAAHELGLNWGKIKTLLHRVLQVDKNDSVSLVHRLSQDSHRRIESQIELAHGLLWDELVSASRDLERSTRELQTAQSLLQQTPEEDSMKPQMERLRDVYERRAKVAAEHERLKAEEAEVLLALAASERYMKKLEGRLDVSEKLAGQFTTIDLAQKALVDYHKSLTSAKADQLGREITECFQQLHRKGDIVASIKVAPETCEVKLFSRFGSPLEKNDLSAGEKQMYAVALLWGLARVSGRQLPLIIDTPLARLDSEHRDNLVRRYFPNAARQVIILSTDTEIDEEYYRALAPFIGRAYSLSYEKAQSVTRVLPGYFWREEPLCAH